MEQRRNPRNKHTFGQLISNKEGRKHKRNKAVSSINGARKTGQLHVNRIILEHSLKPYIKINSKWIKDLDIRPDTMKLLEENIGQALSDINDSNIFSDPPPRVMTVKTKINKWDLSKLKVSAQQRKP